MADPSLPAAVAVIPAAGRGLRLGGNKLLLPWGSGRVIDAVVAAWQACQLQQVVFVVRSDDQPLAEAIRTAAADDPTISFTLADDPPDMKASIQAGIRYVEQVCTAAEPAALLLCPADVVHVSPPIVHTLLQNFNNEPAAIWSPTLAGKRGHPVLYPWSRRDEIFRLTPNQGLRELLEQASAKQLAFDHLPGASQAFADLDTPADYRRLSPPPAGSYTEQQDATS